MAEQAVQVVEEGRKALETVAPQQRDRFPVLISLICLVLVAFAVWRAEARADAQTTVLQGIAKDQAAAHADLETVVKWCCTVPPAGAGSTSALYRTPR